ncbi:MAG: porphobilinogen synthase [Deltaproteobacteria bacterium]|jgi:porphobilinogen synthase|nr:porphobilinogen synthase [Deltaproteobacteria bacterium]
MSEFFRGRRLRMTQRLRELTRETELRPKDLIMPYFVLETEEKDLVRPISSMPGQAQLSPDMLEAAVERAVRAGLGAVILFGLPVKKDAVGSGAYAEDGIIQRATRRLKERYGQDLLVITDICLCEYTAHGHCGLLSQEGEVLNDPTLELLAQTALSHARAGADVVAPSDMMDGRTAAIREALDDSGFVNLPIMSYAVKYASAFYGPFREAAASAPKCGDRKSYQMDSANRLEARREAEADALEGADILIIKPAGPYLDIIRDLRERLDLPLAAYQVSGEYALIKAAGANGWVDESAVTLESLLGIKRAGADMIISYFSADLLQKGLLG